ncbi:hypothetical protein [Paenibacillus sacheonensis]|uniref:Uncharacterized protein n=1 Tax=Paenibacillus sacheonensis TaxID=742054 RepID=A0A7X5C1X8_9BACL|nr:hypothetical protein [Paenibacillus sacheonensis]MBM7567343.1 hypothetical protein [Paenibacillus sacheonensis]NBC69874.1 hypothetical protein [Paenibacillus sacheonensis]
MTNKNQFYCVSCGKMMDNYEADKLFMTGFYRIVYPLGCCKSCTIKLTESSQPGVSGLNPEAVPHYGEFGVVGTEFVKDRPLVFN